MLQRLIVLEVLPRIGEMLGIVDPSDRLGRRCYFRVEADIGGGELQRLSAIYCRCVNWASALRTPAVFYALLTWSALVTMAPSIGSQFTMVALG